MKTTKRMIMMMIMMIILLTNKITSYSAEAENANVNKYPISIQRQVLENADQKEIDRVLNTLSSTETGKVDFDEYGLFWKAAIGNKEIYKVRVRSKKIDFQWTPIYPGYTWGKDLEMWSNGSLSGKNATLEFLDKEQKVLYKADVKFPKKFQKPEISYKVPPCPCDMAPQLTQIDGVVVGEAPGQGPVAK